jgi:hypothetical protein
MPSVDKAQPPKINPAFGNVEGVGASFSFIALFVA